jgi:serine/threonine protein kinase
LPLSTVIRLASQVAGALQAMHSQNLFHQDLCPQTIWVDEESGLVTLADLGQATEKKRESLERDQVSDFVYASPEQLGIINRPIDKRSDLYSLGVILYRCMAGRLPFLAGEDAAELFRQLAAGSPRSL